MPIAVGESIYHPSHFREYLERDACSIVQVDCARIGGVTPWLKVAHLAEAFDEQVARNVSPFTVEPGKFTYRLVRAELEFAEYGQVVAHCRIGLGAWHLVPFTLLPPVEA